MNPLTTFEPTLIAFAETSPKKILWLFYYAGHGKVDDGELCLITNDTTPESLDATSLRADQDVLRYFNRTHSKRKVMILDCCYAGAIADDGSRGGDLDSTLNTLSKRYGTYILTASSASETAREKDGHGVFTKALLDCFHEAWNNRRESLTITDINGFIHKRLAGSPQTPSLTVFQLVGDPIEIGNFKKKLVQTAEQEREQLTSTAREKLSPHVKTGALTEAQVESIVRLLESNEAGLLPHDQLFREKVIRYLKGEVDFVSVFAGLPQHLPLPEPRRVVTYANGDRYYGEVRDDKPNGHGVYTFADGRRYDGEFRDDKPNGRGIYTWPDGRWYDGEWRNAKRNGRGIYTWPDGRRYDGEWRNDKKNGHGVYTWPDGDRYDGEFLDDEYNGHGVYTWHDGRRYAGKWRNGNRVSRVRWWLLSRR